MNDHIRCGNCGALTDDAVRPFWTRSVWLCEPCACSVGALFDRLDVRPVIEWNADAELVDLIPGAYASTRGEDR